MTIAIYPHIFTNEYAETEYEFFLSCTSILAKRYPEHEFVWFVETNAPPLVDSIRPIIVPSSAGLFFSYWKRAMQLPTILKKNNIDLILSINALDNIRTAIPQHQFVSDEWFVLNTIFAQQKKYHQYSKRVRAAVKKMNGVMVQSELAKNELNHLCQIDPEKIAVIPPVVPAFFVPLSDEEKELVKQTYTDGVDYFLYAGNSLSLADFVILLKAFSQFKKWQKSNMQLLLVCRTKKNNDSVEKTLQSYKYKSDVKLFAALPRKEVAKLTAAAYAVVYSQLHPCMIAPIAEALQCGTPIIANRKSTVPEMAQAAALYTETADFEETGGKMIELYRNEQTRNQLIEQGLKYKKEADNDIHKTVDLIWRCLTQE